MTRTIVLPLDSRYGETDLFQVVDEVKKILLNSFIWGTWKPIDFPDSSDDVVHSVAAFEVGRLDLLAARYFSNVNLWWVIAYKNDIVDPFDMVVGSKLRIPTAERVFSALLDTGGRTIRPEPEVTA